MARGIEIDFIANERDVLRGTRSVEDALEQIGDSLDDVARDGDRSLERLEASFKETAKTATRQGREIGDGLGDGVKRGSREASEGVAEAGRETASTAKEMAASFGSVEDALSGVQEIAANALAGFGPAGLAAGAAVAIGMGLALAAGQDLADAINAAKERTGELAVELAEVDGDISQIDIAGKVREWSTEISDNREVWELWQSTAVSNLDRAKTAAEKFGFSAKDMLTGLSGYDADAAKRSLEAVTAAIEENFEAQARNGELNFGANWELDARLQELYGLQNQLESTQDILGDAAEAEKLLTEATGEAAAAAERAAEAERVRADAVTALQAGLDSAVGSFSNYVDAETGVADPGAYLAGMQARIDATSNFNGNVQNLATQFSLSQAEVQAILDQGVEFAPMLQSIINSGMAPEFIAQIQAAVGGGQEILDGTPLGTTVDVDADLTKVETKTKETEKKDRKTQDVKVDADTKPFEGKVTRLTSADYRANVRVDADTSSARRAIDNLERTITVRARIVDAATGRAILQ